MRAVVAVLICLVATLASGCCGYGGPGCGEPGILGLCGTQVGSESRVTLLYFDDTGGHPSDFGVVAATPPEMLVAERGEELGEIVLVGRAPGAAALSVGGIPGWEDQTFVWKLDVVSEIDEVACDGEPGILDPVPEPAGE